MVEKGCESCSKWQEHYCREHMDGAENRFFKLMTGDFAKGISIPKKFVNNFNGQITRGFNLKAPSGETWRVSVARIADEMFFKSGWDDFAKAHELQDNDILFFTCSESYSLNVLIFDKSGCEKVSCFFTGKKDPHMCKHFKGIVDQQAEHYHLSDSEDTSIPSQLVASPHKASTSTKLKTRNKTIPRPESLKSCSYQVKHEVTEEEESDDENADSNYYYSRFAGYLTDEEQEEIISMAATQSGNPVYVVILQKSQIQNRKFLSFRKEFTTKHLERRSHDILLLRPNRKDKWRVRYYHGKASRGVNCQQWARFVRDNELREGYICVFELMKGARKATMTVHVIQKVDGRLVLLG